MSKQRSTIHLKACSTEGNCLVVSFKKLLTTISITEGPTIQARLIPDLTMSELFKSVRENVHGNLLKRKTHQYHYWFKKRIVRNIFTTGGFKEILVFL